MQMFGINVFKLASMHVCGTLNDVIKISHSKM